MLALYYINGSPYLFSIVFLMADSWVGVEIERFGVPGEVEGAVRESCAWEYSQGRVSI